jgi:hypothetical protein
MTTQNTVNNVITDGTNLLTMGGNVAFGAAVTTVGALSFAAAATFGGAVSAAGAITLGGALTTSGANAVTFTTSGATNLTLPTSGTLATTAQLVDMPFSAVTTATQMVVNNRYAATSGATPVAFSLPASPTGGDIVKIIGAAGGGWSIAQIGGQQIKIGSASTTAGATGSVASTNGQDNLELTFISGSLWVADTGYIGNLTVV